MPRPILLRRFQTATSILGLSIDLSPSLNPIVCALLKILQACIQRRARGLTATIDILRCLVCLLPGNQQSPVFYNSGYDAIQTQPRQTPRTPQMLVCWDFQWHWSGVPICSKPWFYSERPRALPTLSASNFCYQRPWHTHMRYIYRCSHESTIYVFKRGA